MFQFSFLFLPMHWQIACAFHAVAYIILFFLLLIFVFSLVFVFVLVQFQFAFAISFCVYQAFIARVCVSLAGSLSLCPSLSLAVPSAAFRCCCCFIFNTHNLLIVSLWYLFMQKAGLCDFFCCFFCFLRANCEL